MTQLSRSRRADSRVWSRGRRSLLLLVLGLSAFCPAAAQGNAELTAYQAKQIEAAVTAHMPRYGIPAISLAIVHEGQIRYKAAFGTIDLENSIPASVSSAFRIASVSKPLTAVAAMQLAESGVLDLDAPV